MPIRKIRQKYFRKTSYFIKLFLSITVVSVIAVIVLSLFTFYFFSTKATEDMNRQYRLELLNIERVLGGYIDSARRTAMELYQNPAIKSIMMTGDREWSGNYSHAVSHTKSVLTANAFINSIYYFNNNEIVLNVTNKTESHDAQEKLFNLVKNNNISVNPTIWELDLMNGGSVHTMTVFFHEGVSAGRNMDYAVAINIDLVELKSNIFADEDASGKSVFIIDRDGNIAMQWGNSIDLDEEHIGRVILSEKPYQMFKSTIDDRYVNIHHLEVEDGKLFIVSVMDYSQSISELIKARNVLLLSSVLIILVTILISIIISHIIYKPLGNIFENIRRYITHPVMKTRGIDEVQLISNTLSGMVERINSLERVNEQNMIVKMIISDDAARDDELDVIERAVLMEKNAVYAVIVLRIDEFDALKEKYNREAIAFQMSSILTMSADFLSEIAHTRAFQVSEDTIALFVSRPADSVLKPDSIIDSLGKLQGTLQRMLKISVTCGVSPVSDKVNQIVDKYRSAYALTKYRLFYGSGHVFGSRFIDTLKNTDIPSSYTDDLVEAVKKSEFNKYEHSFNSLITQCKSHTYKSSVKALTQFAVSIYRLLDGLKEGEIPESHLDYVEVYDYISGFEELTRLNEWSKELYQEASRILTGITEKSIHDTILAAIEYIDNNYTDPQLSLNTVAERFSVSPWYFSRIFNELAGSRFPDYVNNLKLNRARELLSQDQTSDINEIALKVGYNSSTYFTSLFKKKFGVSPSKFRNNSKI